MEIKNLFTPEAQQFGSQLAGVARKVAKPLQQPVQDLGEQFTAKVQPAIQGIQDTVNTSFVEPIMKPIQRNNKIGKVNKFLADKGITVDDIKNLAEADGSDPEEALQFFRDNGIQIEGMEDLQAQEQAKVEEEANKPFALDVNPEYDEVTALSRLTGEIPKFQYSPDEGFLKTAGKMVGNLPASALQVAGGIGDIGLSYARNLDQGPIDAFTETAKAKIINPTIAQAYGIKDIAQEGYKEGGVVGSANKLLEKGTEFMVENPVGAIMTGKGVSGIKRGGQALKTAGTEAMQGNIGKATAGLAKSAGIGIKENIIDPVKMGVTAPLTIAKLGTKGIGAIAKKTGIKAPEGVQNFSNNRAEQLLASQWKLTKPVRKELEGKIGQSGPKFALENDLVGKDIESTADNAGKFKIDKIKEKIEAVKTFGEADTPSVAKNVAQVLKSDIESSVKKSYGKGNTQKVLDENHPELASVYKLADEIIKSDKIDFVKLEQLKELHDYLNPENIQYDISGKPISETRNILSAGKRQKLQQILESEGQKRGIDIKKINKDIQGAYTLEKGLNDTVGRIANLNILGLGDTQTAVISSILGGAPGAVGGLLLKKGLTSEGFIGGLAKSLYSKKNVTPNNSNSSVNSAPPVTRLGRIMNNNSDTVAPKVEPAGVKPKETQTGVPKKITPPSNAKQQGITPKSTTTNIGDRVLNSKESTLSYIESEFKKTLKSNLVKSKEDFIREAGKDFSLSRRDDTLLYRAIKKYKELGGEDFNLGDLYEKIKTSNTPIVKPNTIKNESKVSEPVVPKKTVNTPIVEKSGVEPKKTTKPDEVQQFLDKITISKKESIMNYYKKRVEERILEIREIEKEIDDFIKLPEAKKENFKGTKLSNKLYFANENQKSDISYIRKYFDKNYTLNKSNAKQQGITPRSTTTNVFGETIDKPSNKKGGFIKIPEIGKKSEIKPEIEKYLKTQNIYDKKQGEYGTILKKLSEEYSDGKGGISDEGRLLPKYKEAKKNFDYYFKLLQDFNGLESSKKASKEFNKLGIVERQKIRRQINETKGKINVNDNPIGLVSDSNKSIPVKNPLVEEAKVKPKKAKK